MNWRRAYLAIVLLACAAAVLLFWRRTKVGIYRWQKQDSAYRALARGEIAFFGRLEDQSGEPLTNARVDFSVDASVGFSAHYVSGSTLTDGRGYFTIAGFKGERLSVRPTMVGYVLASTNAGGIYSHFWPQAERQHPDPRRPVIIKMWKIRGAEELVRFTKTLRFLARDMPIHVDLLKGEIVPTGGDIKISLERPAGTISVKQRAQWEGTITKGQVFC